MAKVYTSSYLELKPQRWAGGEKRHFRICVINIALSGSSGKSALLLLACVEPKSDREERTISKVSSESIMIMIKGHRSFISMNMMNIMPFVISSTFPGQWPHHDFDGDFTYQADTMILYLILYNNTLLVRRTQ